MTSTSKPPMVQLTGSNATITSEQGRTSLSFPRDEGVLEPARWQFKDRGELVEFLADILQVPMRDGGVRGTLRRHGKYVRRNGKGEKVTTFGDPILDLITNDHGEIIIGGQRLSIGRAELQEPKYRLGGVSDIDLGTSGAETANYHLRRAAMGEGDCVLTECTGGLVAFASTNPSQRDYFLDGDHLRFKAWKKSRFMYWSMGAEIETWGHDFTQARIDSRYLATVFGQTCTAVKVDSDSDTNDDYLDEYEWGVNAPQPLRVVSFCTARWKGSDYTGQVEAGPDCFEV